MKPGQSDVEKLVPAAAAWAAEGVRWVFQDSRIAIADFLENKFPDFHPKEVPPEDRRGISYPFWSHMLRRRKILELMAGQERGGRVLDLGSGTGDLAVELALRGLDVVGVDQFAPPSGAFIDEQLARALAERYRVRVRFVRGAAEDLSDLASASFDCVFMGEILEHFAEPAEVLKGVHRVLRPGGRLIVTVPNVASLGSRWCLVYHGYLLDGWVEHRQHFNIRELSRMLREQGFEPETITSDFVDVPRLGMRSEYMGRPWLLKLLVRLAERYPQMGKSLLVSSIQMKRPEVGRVAESQRAAEPALRG